MNTNSWLRAIPLVPLLLLIALPARTEAQGDDLRKEFRSVRGNAKHRLEWFYRKRAFPADTLRHGYFAKALEQIRSYGPGRTLELAWTSIGPRPGSDPLNGPVSGRVPALAVHPTNPLIVYAGAADGGVWKSTDGGATWVPKTDDLASLATGSIAIAPSDPDRIVWGTGEPYYAGDAYGGAGVFLSTDGGDSWASIGLASEKRIPALVIDPANPNTIFAATWGGVYRTTDAGASWDRTLPAGYACDLAVHPANAATVYAAVGDNNTDAGVYRSTDGGTTWSRLAGGLPAPGDINRIRLAVAPSSPSRLYALISSRVPFGGLLGLYRTTNGGTSWTRLHNAPATLFGGNNQGWYDIAVAVSPTDPALVLIGGVDLYRSANGGNSWTNVSGSVLHPDQHAVAFGPGVVYAGNDGGVWRSTTGGTSWVNRNTGLAVTQFYALGTDRSTPSRIYGGTQDNGTQRTEGAVGWTGVLGGDGGMVAVDPFTSNVVLAETQFGGIARSTNGGLTFTPVFTASGAWVTPLRMDPHTPGVAYTANTRILRSTDGGTTWRPVSDALNGQVNIQWVTVHPTLQGTLYAASAERLFRTTDGGASWAAVHDGLPGRYIEQAVVDPHHPSTVYVTVSGTGGGHVFRSADRGDTWTDISGDLPDIPANAVSAHPGLPGTLYLGTDLGLFVTTDGGSAWRKETGLPNAAVVDLALTSDGHLLAATHGRSAFRAPIVEGPFGAYDSLLLPVEEGWNMVSVPYAVPDRTARSLFPEASSPAFTFTPSGFQARDTLEHGAGYWIRLAEGTVTLVGLPRVRDTIAVRPGWNLIGSIGFSLSADGILQDPPGVLTSPFIGRDGPAATIEKGRSYWVSAGEPGRLILTRPASTTGE